MPQIFLTGGTGYIGSRLAARLVERGHRVRALVRATSASKLPSGVEPVIGDALDAASFSDRVEPGETFVQLVGTPHPSPAKAKEFQRVDLGSVRASVTAARGKAGHFVYVSIAHPAPAMQAYIAVRTEGERLIAESGLLATMLRPWYVLGPGHYWPYLLVPGYWLLERIPSTRESAKRLGLVTIHEMVASVTFAIEHPPTENRIYDVAEIRKTSRQSSAVSRQRSVVSGQSSAH